MAGETQQTEVTLKLNVATGDGERGMKMLADSTRKASQEAKGAQREFDAFAEAQRRLHRIGQEQEVREHMKRLTPPPLPGQRPPWYAAGNVGAAIKTAAPVLGSVAMAGKFLSAGADTLNESARLSAERATLYGGNATTAGENVALFARKLEESIPIIGSFAKAAREFSEALYKGEAIAAQSRVSIYERDIRTGTFAMQQRAQTERTVYGFNVSARDSSIEARRQAEYYQSLTPDRLARYRGAYGGAYQAIDEAGVAVKAARDRAALSGRDVDAERQAVLSRRPWAAGAFAEAGAANEAFRSAQMQADAARSGGGASQAAELAAVKEPEAARKRMLDAQQKLNTAVEGEIGFQQKVNQLQKDALDVAEKEKNLRLASLGLRQQIAGGAEGRAMRYGVGSPGQALQDEQILRMIKANGWEGVSPAMRERAMAIPGAAEILGPQVRAFGDRQGAGVRNALGDLASPDQRAQILKPLDQQQDEISKLRQQINSEAAKANAEVAKQWATDMASSVRAVMTDVVDQFKAEMMGARQAEILMRKGQ